MSAFHHCGHSRQRRSIVRFRPQPDIAQYVYDARTSFGGIGDPNELVAPIHPKAMVTVLARGRLWRWLSGSYDDVVALQQPYPAEKMAVRGPVFPTRRDQN